MNKPLQSGRLLVALWMFGMLSLAAQEKPVIEIAPTVHNLGSIPDNQPVQCVFTLTNHSQQVVKIVKVNTPCVCTAVKPDPDVLAPGAQTRISVTLNPKGRSGFLRWEVAVVTDLLEMPLILPFHVTIYKDGFLSHDAVYFGEVRRGAEVERKIWVSPRLYPDFRITRACVEVADQPESFDVAWEAVVYDGFYPAPRRAYCVRVAPRKDIAFGRIEGTLHIATDAPGHEKIEIPVAIVVSGEIGLSRDYLALGLVGRHKKVNKNIMVYNREGKSFAITKTHIDLPFARCETRPIIPDQYFEVNVIANADDKTPAGEFRGRLTITTSSQEQPEIFVTVQGFVPLASEGQQE